MNKEMIERLVRMKSDLEALRDDIEQSCENGEIVGASLWGAEHDVDSTIGLLFAEAYKAGAVTFSDKQEG